MKGLVLCAVFLVLGGNQSFGVNVNLDFLNDPDFPGNAGWNAKLNQQIADTVNNPDFPGNAGWNAKLDQQIKDTMNSAMNSANTGSSGSNVVAPTVTGSRPPRPMREPRPPRPMRPNVVRPRPPRPMRPNVVRPRPPRPMKPEVVRPIPSILPDNENNIMKDPVPVVEEGKKEEEKEKEKEEEKKLEEKKEEEKKEEEKKEEEKKEEEKKEEEKKVEENKKSPCTEVPDPKIKFKEDNYDSFMIYTVNGVQQIPKIEKKYFLCTDKKYGNDDYYIVKTIKSYGPNSFSSWENVFDKKGEKMGYSSHTGPIINY